MSKKTGQGHISVKGPIYWAFREACHGANLAMGSVLDKLIVSALDLDEDFWVPVRKPKDYPKPKEPPRELIDIKTEIWEDTADYRVPDPYHVEVSRKKPAFTPVELAALQAPVEEQLALKHQLIEEGTIDSPAGLFSAQGIADAEIEAKAHKVQPKRAAKGTEPPAFHEIKSCIDPTFGKKR
jgi:hypothetical protein